MRRLVLLGLASLSTVLFGGLLAGCGDNQPRVADGGGTGGSGSGGTDGGMGDRTDTNQDRGDVGETGSGGAGGTDGGADGGTCPAVSFVSPTNAQVLTAADDASGMSCASGFKYNVTVSVTATNGTAVELHGAVATGTVTSPPLLATGTVMANQVVFSNVQLSSEAMTQLSVEIGGVPCAPRVTVTVSCNLPTCTISSPSHDTLNGVPVPDGDRASSPGSDYQAAFTVMTNIEDGQPVVLTVTSLATPPAAPAMVTVNAMSGAATFVGVTLKPDGQYKIAAACTNKANAVGHSTNATYTVDSTAPTLVVDQPMNGATFGPTDLTNGAFKVCGTTTSADAVNLPPSAGTSASNLCVQRGQSKGCVPVTMVNTSTCLNVSCPGGAPFDLTVTLTDAAGNPQTKTITGISCTSSLPAVNIATPLTDSPNFANPAKRLLAATSSQPLKDADGATAGAQTTVVACTDTMGGSARLFAGLRGGPALTALGAAVTVVPAVAADGCLAGLGFVAKFTSVTLPESTEGADGSLMAATEIRVDVTDPLNAAGVGTSGPTDLWVDSIVPTLSEKTPTPLCGSTQAAAGTFTTPLTLNSSTAVVTLNVTNGTTAMFGPPTYAAGTPTGVVTFAAVNFPQGQNVVISTATEPSGNTASLTPPIPMPMCTVTVGAAPIVSFTTPGTGQNLCATGNALATCIADTGAAAGWQGDITVHVQTPGGAPITTGNVIFTIAGGTPQMIALGTTGNATLPGVTIADATAVLLTAATDGVPAGTAMKMVNVDTQNPAIGTAFMATPLDRRQTSFTVSWTAPDDSGKPVVDYDIHVKGRDPVSGDPCGLEIRSAVFSGTPVATGATQSITIPNLFIETDYCFTVAGKDFVGNVGPILSGMGRADFQTTVISGTGTENIGFAVDGTGDLGAPGTFTNDGKSDLIVGAALGTKVYVFMGRTGGYPMTPDITITGPVSRFGTGAIAAGDLDGDGLTDIAIGSRDEVPAKVYIFSRKNPPASWGTTTNWPAALTAADANYTITGDATYNATRFGYSLGRMGNFDGAGSDELAIGAMLYDGAATDAGRVVVVKGSSAFGSITLPDTTNTTVIDGEAASDYFGWGLEVVPGNILIVSGYGAAPASGGKVYAFQGLSGTMVSAGTADDITVYPTAGAQYGFVVGTLGALGMSPAAVTVTSNVNPAFVDVHMVTAALGPFGGARLTAPVPTIHLTSSATGTAFGAVNIGSVVSGTAGGGSIIGGDTVPDLVLAGQNAASSAIYVVSGSALATMSGNVDVANPAVSGVVTIKNKLPVGWVGYGRGSLVVDLNGDGYSDFAFGEFATGTGGRTVVFW